jgi:hypothetical protein
VKTSARPRGHPPGLSAFWVDSALERLSGDHDNHEGHDRLKRPPDVGAAEAVGCRSGYPRMMIGYPGRHTDNEPRTTPNGGGLCRSITCFGHGRSH